MNTSEIYSNILEKQSYLCVGLDTDPDLIPSSLQNQEDPVFEFNKMIIDATRDLAVAYKINTAFYEAQGARGWSSMKKTVDYIPENIFKIADAKRGDTGNTSTQYAKAFFENMSFDAVTISPYMGKETILPFLDFSDKYVIVLALTSNSGNQDFQMMEENEEKLYERVIRKVNEWGDKENTMFVVGANHAKLLKEIRVMAPGNFLLIPGIGAQSGDLNLVSENGMNEECGIFINASRSIIYASNGEDFAEAARLQAQALQNQMRPFLQKVSSS